tara:strand:- start:66 stop:242 length:177 start_codon:yes stop_codon:yes gene_type:complete
MIRDDGEYFREWAFEEAEQALSHIKESPSKSKLVYQHAMQLIEEMIDGYDIDGYDDGV